METNKKLRMNKFCLAKAKYWKNQLQKEEKNRKIRTEKNKYFEKETKAI